MKSAITVFWKEVRENLRDKRTVFSALIYGPLIAPVMFVVLMNTVIQPMANTTHSTSAASALATFQTVPGIAIHCQ